MAYDNIRIVSQHGNIYDDSGYIHMDIEANFIVFQPKKGQKLLVRFTFTHGVIQSGLQYLSVCLGLAVMLSMNGSNLIPTVILSPG